MALDPVRRYFRYLLATLAFGAILAASAPATAHGAFGVEGWVAANCGKTFEACGEGAVEPTKAQAETEGFTQAAGHPPFGITDFKVNTEAPAHEKPEGKVTHVRVDVAPGVATNPQAAVRCGENAGESLGAEVPGGVFLPPTCSPESEIGENKVLVYVEGLGDIELEGTVYNLVQPQGRASEFGVALELPAFLAGGHAGLFAHTLIEGGVEWGEEAAGTGKGDYHDYFEINVSPTLPLVESRLIFEGNLDETGEGVFLTNPSTCTGPGPGTTSRIVLKSEEGATASRSYTTPIGASGCNLVPFEPTMSVTPETTQSDRGDGITTNAGVPHNPEEESLDDSQVKTAVVTMPEGMTLNPSAARGLEACTPKQARIHSPEPGTACPAGSKIGTVELNVPGLPPGSLTGNVYLGGPESGPITGPPYTMYFDAESARYGVSVRIKGEVEPNEATGRVTATFKEIPEQPFTNAILHFNGGALAPIANPLVCGTATTGTTFTPFTGTAPQSPTSAFTVDSNGSGGACPSPLPFAPAQSTSDVPATAGSHPAFTFNLERGEGQQYVGKVRTVLPEGLIGLVPAVGQCTEAQALAAACPESSLIGTVTASAGSGTPYPFPGKVYFMGPTKGAPYGMAFVVPAVAGPFNLGNVVTLATINVEPFTARVIVTSELPMIVKGGVPVRMRSLSVTVNHSGFLLNPTSCATLATESAVTGITGPTAPLSGGTTVSLASPFAVTNCTALPFKPKFGSASSGKTSKASGASLETTLNLPSGSSNVRSVLVQLPKQLPSRLTTLQQACPESTFAINPFKCPSGSFVGGARANTPALPNKMSGPAILVSHGGEAFPDLDLLMEADGVRVILVGKTNIKKGITTTNFATTPDVPVSSITVNLPIGSHSALAANGALCGQTLLMPTTITAYSGAVTKQNTAIKVKGCPVRIVGHRVIGNTAYLTVQTYAAGRISGGGPSLATVYRHLSSASARASLKVSLSRGGRSRRRPFRTRVRVGFLPKSKAEAASAAFVTVTF